MLSLYTISTWIHRISFSFIQFCIKKYDEPSVQSIHDQFSLKKKTRAYYPFVAQSFGYYGETVRQMVCANEGKRAGAILL